MCTSSKCTIVLSVFLHTSQNQLGSLEDMIVVLKYILLPDSKPVVRIFKQANENHLTFCSTWILNRWTISQYLGEYNWGGGRNGGRGRKPHPSKVIKRQRVDHQRIHTLQLQYLIACPEIEILSVKMTTCSFLHYLL